MLLSYGGEDPAQLTGKTAKLLVEKGYFTPGQITAVIGPFFKETILPEGVKAVHSPETLEHLYSDNDLVFTSFGITPYEAAGSGVPVLLLNPTGYHRKCTRMAGFPEIGVKNIDRRKLRFYLQNRELLAARSAAPLPETPVSLAETIASLTFSASTGCPACGTAVNRAVARFPEKSCFACSNCGALYSIPITEPEEYGTEYFFSEYKQQYGKTYLQDYLHILKLSERRMGRILSVLERKKSGVPPALMDIGCAYGPFLEAARDAGCTSYGIDVSPDAVKYTAENLGIPTAVVSFQEFDTAEIFQRDSYDIITMWYVIEHMKDLKKTVTKIHSLLKPGGVFAFSTPNLTGISGRRDLQKYLKISPQDHVTLLSPGWAGRYLRRRGFNTKRICITGHHPERFPGMTDSTGMSGKAGRLSGYIYSLISRLFRLGETFEMYVVKQ